MKIIHEGHTGAAVACGRVFGCSSFDLHKKCEKSQLTFEKPAANGFVEYIKFRYIFWVSPFSYKTTSSKENRVRKTCNYCFENSQLSSACVCLKGKKFCSTFEKFSISLSNLTEIQNKSKRLSSSPSPAWLRYLSEKRSLKTYTLSSPESSSLYSLRNPFSIHKTEGTTLKSCLGSSETFFSYFQICQNSFFS